MKVRKVFFWAHLSCGVAAGIIVLIVSLTGAVMAYEPQWVAWAEGHNRVAAVPTTAPLSAEQLVSIARKQNPAAAHGTLVLSADPAVPARITMGNAGKILLDPYTGAVMEDQAAGVQVFMRTMQNWHRWLGGKRDSIGASLVDVANLLFLFMIGSGLYLWLPERWRWPAMKMRLFFNTRLPSGKARDFNWHHVFGIWAFVPLFVLAFSGVVMSFTWANKLLFAAYGEVPVRGGPPGAIETGLTKDGSAERASLDALLAAAKSRAGAWQTLSVPLAASGDVVTITAQLKDKSTSPQLLKLAATDAHVLSMSETPTPVRTPGQSARRWIRFAHTGQEYGVVGQTVAALASLAACFLVYTGLLQAYRRLIVPLYRK